VLSILPRIVTTLKWKITKDGKPTDKEDEKERLGKFKVSSLNLAKLLEDEAKSCPVGLPTRQESIVSHFTQLIAKYCPNVREVSLEIFCTVVEKLPEEEQKAEKRNQE